MQLIAADYDGAFHPNQFRVNRISARRWRKAGGKFGFVTGRGLDFINRMAKAEVEHVF